MESIQERRLTQNTLSSIAFRILAAVSGLILPRLYLLYFGSEINGLVNSIGQFLCVASLLEFGMGAVVQAELYKPLSDGDNGRISEIFSASNRFFRRIAAILFVYSLIAGCCYPLFIKQSIDYWFTASLFFIMAVNSLVQYLWGVTNELLLSSDQRVYIDNICRIVILIVSTSVSVILIKFGYGIHVIQTVATVCFCFKPVVINLYVKKNYSIDKSIKPRKDDLPSKRNAVIQHIAAFVLEGTDVIVLSLFSMLHYVSVYGIYLMPINFFRRIFVSATEGIRALEGDFLAKNETEELKRIFSLAEWGIHNATTLLFGITGMTIVPFVSVYTKGINDAAYNQPLFGLMITLAYAFYCLRLPYHVIILAAGHFKQTQKYFLISMLLNIIISVAGVWKFGLIGVAIGTLVAMFFHTIWMAWYDSKNIINWSINNFFKLLATDLIIAVIAGLLSSKLEMSAIGYVDWIVFSIKIGAVWASVALIINLVFYRDKLKALIAKLKLVSKEKM